MAATKRGPGARFQHADGRIGMRGICFLQSASTQEFWLSLLDLEPIPAEKGQVVSGFHVALLDQLGLDYEVMQFVREQKSLVKRFDAPVGENHG